MQPWRGQSNSWRRGTTKRDQQSQGLENWAKQVVVVIRELVEKGKKNPAQSIEEAAGGKKGKPIEKAGSKKAGGRAGKKNK